MALSDEAARSRSVGVGDRVDLVLGDGTGVDPRVVAVYRRGLGYRPVVLPADLAAGHTGSGLPGEVLVRTDASAAVRERLAEFVAERPGLALVPTDRVATIGPDARLNLAANAALLGYVLVGAVNTLVAGTLRRRSELASLRFVGATPRQLRRMVLGEATLVSGMAVVAGVAASALPLALLGVALLGWPWPAGPVWLVPATVAAAVALGWVGTVLPARHLLRAPARPV